MQIKTPERWQDIFGFIPIDKSINEIRKLVAMKIREMCNDLNQRNSRREIVNGLKRLEQAGKILEDHFWLQGD